VSDEKYYCGDFIVATATFVVAQAKKDTAVEAEIIKLENEYDRANAKNDVAALDKLTADDFLVTYFIPPKLMTKAQRLAEAKAAQPFTVESSALGDLKVRIHGDSAVVTGTWKESRKAKDGKVKDVTGRLTDVWLKMAGQWKLEAEHASPDAVR
jgi:ketosteroid isomerase-like protein